MKPIFPLVAALGLASCVTINIYFPAAAAEKVADKIIEEVWQTGKDAAKKPEASAPAKEKEAK